MSKKSGGKLILFTVVFFRGQEKVWNTQGKLCYDSLAKKSKILKCSYYLLFFSQAKILKVTDKPKTRRLDGSIGVWHKTGCSAQNTNMSENWQKVYRLEYYKLLFLFGGQRTKSCTSARKPLRWLLRWLLSEKLDDIAQNSTCPKIERKKIETIHCQNFFEGVKNSNSPISPKIAEMTVLLWFSTKKGESKTKSQHVQKPKKNANPNCNTNPNPTLTPTLTVTPGPTPNPTVTPTLTLI